MNLAWERKHSKYRRYNCIWEARKGDFVVLYMPGDVAVGKVVTAARRKKAKRGPDKWTSPTLRYYGDPDLDTQTTGGRFVPLWVPCYADPPCPPREKGQTLVQHTNAKAEACGHGRRRCRCGQPWLADFEPDLTVIANFKSLQEGRLPRPVVEVLRRDPNFGPTWDFALDAYCGPDPTS